MEKLKIENIYPSTRQGRQTNYAQEFNNIININYTSRFLIINLYFNV